MESQNKYIGDESLKKFLGHYGCPTPLPVVKMKFAGAVCSPNLDLRPADVISSFWPAGQAPRLETKNEADLFFKFFMGLWDEVFQKVRENKIKLSAEYPDLMHHHPHVDQHAPSYLCMDEYSFRQWSGEQPSENAGNFTDHHDVYRFFGYCGPCL